VTRPKVRAVLFDYGGVLTEGLGPLFIGLVEGSGASIPELATLLIGSYGEDGDHMWHRLERGEVSFQEFCDWARAEGTQRGWQLDLSAMPELLGKLAIREGVVARVRELRAAGYRTGLITNNVREFNASWRPQLPVDELFEIVVDSSATGLRKPNPRIYELALERLGVQAEEAVFLDDFPVNVEGARQVGMHAILVGEDWQQALTELDELLAVDRPA
jgi:putative hydrolase of the HAD superfamily